MGELGCQDYLQALVHPIAQGAYELDFGAMKWANATVMVMPCGRSAHLEAGWSIGQGKPTCIYVPDHQEPLDLMHKMADIVFSLAELEEWTERYVFCPKCDLQCTNEEDAFNHLTQRNFHLTGPEAL